MDYSGCALASLTHKKLDQRKTVMMMMRQTITHMQFTCCSQLNGGKHLSGYYLFVAF